MSGSKKGEIWEFGTLHFMEFWTLSGVPVYKLGMDPRQGLEKSRVGVGIELEALQPEDCHDSQQATEPQLYFTVQWCLLPTSFVLFRIG